MPLQDLKEKCAKDFWTTTVIEMVVWPPYQVDHSLFHVLQAFTICASGYDS